MPVHTNSVKTVKVYVDHLLVKLLHPLYGVVNEKPTIKDFIIVQFDPILRLCIECVNMILFMVLN